MAEKATIFDVESKVLREMVKGVTVKWNDKKNVTEYDSWVGGMARFLYEWQITIYLHLRINIMAVAFIHRECAQLIKSFTITLLVISG